MDMNVIFLEILPRLPAKTLIRFKCVSKSFNSEISSKEFAHLYLRHRCISSANDLLILPGDRHINCYDLDSSISNATFAWAEGFVSVIGSSNGLLCILTSDRVDYLTVLNPTTGFYRDIRSPDSEGRVHNLGFTFDHENLDFKIVSVSDRYNDKAATKTRNTRVYSLNTDSWKVIKRVVPSDSMEERHGGVLISNNLLHWMFWNPSLRKRRIGCFDVCKMKWTDNVLLPHYYYDPGYKTYLLDFGVFDECLFTLFKNRVDSCFDVWVMKEYGIQDSWFKLLSFPALNDLLGGFIPIARRRGSDEILVRKCHSSKVFWYDTNGGGMTEAKFYGAPDFSNPCMCNKSLVELPGGTLVGEHPGNEPGTSGMVVFSRTAAPVVYDVKHC